jgi:hypothetical protein
LRYVAHSRPRRETAIRHRDNPGLSWHAIGTGAGGSDILLQNTSGQVSIWEMHGNTIVGGQLQCLPQASFPYHFLEPRVALPPRRFAGKGNMISHKTLDLDDGSLWGAKYRIEGAGAPQVSFLSAANSSFAIGPAEAGFWPVMSRPSTTTFGCQFAVEEYSAPSARSASSSS